MDSHMIDVTVAEDSVKLTPFQMMESYLNDHYGFLHNVVLNRVEYLERRGGDMGGGDIDDYKLNSILSELLRNRINVTKPQLISYLFSENSEQFDPFQNYFEELPPWRPHMPDYIQLLADTITVPEGFKEIWEVYLRKWLIATVGCAIDTKITNQQVLVFMGVEIECCMCPTISTNPCSCTHPAVEFYQCSFGEYLCYIC